MNRKDVLGLMGVAAAVVAVWLFLSSFIDYAHYIENQRALECSELLHGYSRGTLVPLTDDASVEIGACLLQFNQPVTGETQ